MDVCPFPRTGYPTPHCATVYTPPNYHRQYRTANKMGTAQHGQPCPHLPGPWAHSPCPSQGQSWAWNTGKKQAPTGCSKLLCHLQELCLGRIICNWITLYSKEGSLLSGHTWHLKYSLLGRWPELGWVCFFPQCPRPRGGVEGLPELSGMSVLHSLSWKEHATTGHTEHTGSHGKSCQGLGEYTGSDKHRRSSAEQTLSNTLWTTATKDQVMQISFGHIRKQEYKFCHLSSRWCFIGTLQTSHALEYKGVQMVPQGRGLPTLQRTVGTKQSQNVS